jgi:hypothetical protein
MQVQGGSNKSKAQYKPLNSKYAFKMIGGIAAEAEGHIKPM